MDYPERIARCAVGDRVWAPWYGVYGTCIEVLISAAIIDYGEKFGIRLEEFHDGDGDIGAGTPTPLNPSLVGMGK